MPDDKADDIKVKQLLEGGAALTDMVDAATQAELARWFQLPSFQQVAEKGPVEDPEIAAVRERRAKACEAVDPALLSRIHLRTDERPVSLIKNEYVLPIHVKEDVGLFDQAMAERGHQIAEPREVEIPEELRDDLKDCTPQALLRDLHRAELYFEKTFEVVDMSAEQKLDIVAEVDAAMKMNLKLPPLGMSPFEEERRRLVQDRALWKVPCSEWPMPNRRISE